MPRISTRRDNYPWFAFYPKDWAMDNGLNMCSLAAKGLWIDMLARMWQSPERGVLPGDPGKLCRLLGEPVEGFMPYLEELEENQVISRGRDIDDALEPDALVSRRMWREARTSAARAEAGSRGGRAAADKQNPSKTPANHEQTVQQNPPPKSSDGRGLPGNPYSKTPANPKQTPKPLSAEEGRRKKEEGIKHKTAEGPTAVKDLLGQIPESGPPGDIRRVYFDRLMGIKDEDEAWREWWWRVLARLHGTDNLSALDEHLLYAEQCADPVARNRKGLGPLSNPGAYVVGKILTWSRIAGVKLPNTPERSK